MAKKLRKTSVQLSEDTLEYLNLWPGLSQSEAIRLIVERYQFLDKRASIKLSPLAQSLFDQLKETFEGLDYRDYRAAQSILPESVGTRSEHECVWLMGFVLRKEIEDERF